MGPFPGVLGKCCWQANAATLRRFECLSCKTCLILIRMLCQRWLFSSRAFTSRPELTKAHAISIVVCAFCSPFVGCGFVLKSSIGFSASPILAKFGCPSCHSYRVPIMALNPQPSIMIGLPSWGVQKLADPQ